MIWREDEMILISYDISDDKLRTQFSKYLQKFGHRIQYSVFEIDNSRKVLNNIMLGIEHNFKKSLVRVTALLFLIYLQAVRLQGMDMQRMKKQIFML